MAGERGLAEEIRTGLEPEGVEIEGMADIVSSAPSKRGVMENQTDTSRDPLYASKDPLAERWHGKPIRRHIREFGVVFFVLGALVSAYLGYKGAKAVWPAAIVGSTSLLLMLCFVAPAIIRPIWRGWMNVAEFLGAIVTTLILSLTWVLMMIPVGIALRLFRVKVMDTSYGVDVASYWEERDPKKDDFKLLEKQF